MAERNAGRPWTTTEDRLLTEAVHEFGETDQWKTIAVRVPGRTNKACRKRWLHSLSPSVKKTAWTLDEDQRLLQLHAAFGPKWSNIARQIPGRTDDACSKRYREALDPSLNKHEWTQEEDEKLIEVYAVLGGKWGQVGRELQRSGLGCRNRWRLLERKRASAAAKETPCPAIAAQLTPNLPEYFPEEEPSLANDVWNPDGMESFHWYNSGSAMTSPDTSDSLMISSPILVHDACSIDHHPVPPFQFTSSSLSAALSAQPLPPVDVSIAAVPASSTKPNACHDPLIPVPCLMEGLPFSSEHHNSAMDLDRSCTPPINLPSNISPSQRRSSELEGALLEPQTQQPDYVSNTQDADAIAYSADLHAIQDRLPRPNCTPESEPLSHSHPPSDFPSNTSSPIGLAGLSLSPSASPPNLAVPVGLPNARYYPSSQDSALFRIGHHRPGSSLKPRVARKIFEASNHRLSSSLAVAADPNILPYACGHERCWPTDMATSSARFATSGELSDHNKTEHTDGLGGDRPFRCALDGCGKSWKNINGLQYHLQISTAHFRHAITSTFSSQIQSDSSATTQGVPKESRRARKHYACTYPQCYKVYKQLSGLRYHLMHGHPREMPAQLDTIPPTLARQVDQKLRTKDPQVVV